MKNKQIVIELHEGCINPNEGGWITALKAAKSDEERSSIAKKYLMVTLAVDPDLILIDKVELIDCDCETES